MLALLLGIIIAYYLIFTQSIKVFEFLFTIVSVPYAREVSVGSAVLLAGFVAGWMAHRYQVPEWRVGLLAGLSPIVVNLMATTLVGDLVKMIRQTPPHEYGLIVGGLVLTMLASKLGALTRGKVRPKRSVAGIP